MTEASVRRSSSFVGLLSRTSSFFKFRNKANFYSFLGASAGTGAPRNTQKIGTQCRCEYGYKNHESFGSLDNTYFFF